MRITIVAAGKIKEKYLTMGIDEFIKRITPYAKVKIIEIDEERMPDRPSEAEKRLVLEKEGVRLLKQAPVGGHLIVLDVGGEKISSEAFAGRIQSLGVRGESHLVFIIGGAFGLSSGVRQAAKDRLSFSDMTFTHQMARLLLVEQLYRAFKIMRGEPYHL